MGLNKGQTNNPNGRPKGSKNKTSQELRQYLIDAFFDVEEIQKDFEQLDAQQRMHFRKEFAGFVLPKLQAQAIMDGSERPKPNLPAWMTEPITIDFRDAE